MVEEVAVASWRSLLILNLAYLSLDLALAFTTEVYFTIFVLIICLLASKEAIEEIGDWYNEIYVIARDTNGGGRVYKFYGWWGKSMMSDKITETTPAYSWSQPLRHRVWGYITGEQMMRVVLFSQNNNIYIQGQRIAPEFISAIQLIRGAPALEIEAGPNNLADLRHIKQAYVDGLIDKQTAQHAAMHIVFGLTNDR